MSHLEKVAFDHGNLDKFKINLKPKYKQEFLFLKSVNLYLKQCQQAFILCYYLMSLHVYIGNMHKLKEFRKPQLNNHVQNKFRATYIIAKITNYQNILR